MLAAAGLAVLSSSAAGDGSNLSIPPEPARHDVVQAGDGIPEIPDHYEPVPKSGRWLDAAEARAAFPPLLAGIRRRCWWSEGVDPGSLRHALREPASVVSGCVAAHRAGLDEAQDGLSVAREAARFLMDAQQQGGAGLFPFPAVRGRVETRDKAFTAAARFLQKAAKEGRLGNAVRGGWIIEDFGDGGLQFDNGVAGVAMLELWEAVHDARLLESALRSADWAMRQPLARNWNYNSFSVRLLAKAYEATHRNEYLEAAISKARLGVIPGQLTRGPQAGRWGDPHNARPAYHYIMMGALAELVLVIPEADPRRGGIMQSLELGLRARNPEFAARGIMNMESAMETLVTICSRFSTRPEFLSATHSLEALNVLGILAGAQCREGTNPIPPRALALYLGESVRRGSAGTR